MPPKPCIRCPDEADKLISTHKPDDNFVKCRKEYPLATTEPNKSSKFWWPFNAGPTPAGLDLTDPQICHDLLQHVQRLDLAASPPKKTASNIEDWVANAKAKAASSIYLSHAITKGMLEEALGNVVKHTSEGWEPDPSSASSVPSASPKDADVTGLANKTAQLGVGDTADSSIAQGSGSHAPPPPPPPLPATPATLVPVSTFQRHCGPGESHRDQWQGRDTMPDARGIARPNSSSPHSQTEQMGQIQHFQTQAEVDKAAKNAKNKIVLDFYAPRTAVSATNEKIRVLTNHFKLKISEDAVLYEYCVTGLPNQVSRPKRRMLILDMLEMHTTLWDLRNEIATDHYSKVISSKPLISDSGAKISVSVPDFNRGIQQDQVSSLTLTLQFVKTHSLKGLNDFVHFRDQDYADTGASDALSIVMAKAIRDIHRSGDFFEAGKNRYYFRRGWDKLRVSRLDCQGLLAIRGYFFKIKPGAGEVLLNVNTVTNAFYEPKLLSAYIDKLTKDSKDPRDQWTGVRNHLKGLRVSVDFERKYANDDQDIDNPGRRVKTLAGFGKEPEDETVEGTQTSVWNHLSGKYPEACLPGDKQLKTGNVGKAKSPKKFYLASQLRVRSDQMYRRNPMPPEVTEEMIRTARRTPQENVGAIVGEGLSAVLDANGQMPRILTSLGISIIPRMITLPARWIVGPDVYLGNNTKIPTGQQGFWNFPKGKDVKFANTSLGFDDSSIPTVQFFSPSEDLAYPEFEEHYLANFRNLHTANGLKQLHPHTGSWGFVKIRQWASENLLHEELSRYKSNLGLAVLVLPDNNAENRAKYAKFKIVVDQRLGIKSICFNEKRMTGTLTSAIRDGRAPFDNDALAGYMRNITMKLNLRCGNWNHTVDLSSDVPASTMVLGADVTHPPSGSGYSSPSIAAVVGSIDSNCALFPGSMRLNTSRQEWIDGMQSMVTERLEDWFRHRKNLPRNIIYYRDGVSEEYFHRIREHEINAIHKAYRNIRAKHGAHLLTAPKTVNVTTVVVIKRHHTRFYPLLDGGNRPVNTDYTSANGNCSAGLVVDSGVTSPYYFDFFLQSHNVLAGTGKPTHYFVIDNGMKLKPATLQNFTAQLCYAYGRGNSAVSYATPAYYADRLCERGRLYLQSFYDEMRVSGAKDADGNPLADTDIDEKAKTCFKRGGEDRKNPWHENHDGKMFWM